MSCYPSGKIALQRVLGKRFGVQLPRKRKHCLGFWSTMWYWESLVSLEVMLEAEVFPTPEWSAFRKEAVTTWDIRKIDSRGTCQLEKRVSCLPHGSVTWDTRKGGIETKWWSFNRLRSRMHKRRKQGVNAFFQEKAHIHLSCPERGRIIGNCVGKTCKRNSTRGMSSRLWAPYCGLFGGSIFTSPVILVQVRPTAGLKSEQPGMLVAAPTWTRSWLYASLPPPPPSLSGLQRTLCLHRHVWMPLLLADTYALWTESWVEVGGLWEGELIDGTLK